MEPFDPEEVSTATMESPRLNELKAWLRREVTQVRMDFLKRCIELRGAGAGLATSVVNDKVEAVDLFRTGLASITTPHSQTTRAWIEFGVTKLGARRVIRELEPLMDSLPHVVDMALYWLPTMIPKKAPGFREMRNLKREAMKNGVVRPPRQTAGDDGTILFHDRYSP
jgi:hypothetical protein